MEHADLEIRLLGPLELVAAEERLELPPSRKTRALLAYLVTTSRPHSRTALCDLFWQDVNDPRAGLRWALSKLRAVVNDGAKERIETSGDLVEFATTDARVDLHRVQAAVGRDPSSAAIESLLDASRAFRGPFLEGLDLSGCHRFQAWSLGTRERLRSLHVSVLSTLVRRLEDDPQQALPHALDRLAIDAFSEEPYLQAMEVLGALGRFDQALALHDRCSRMLSEHLGAPPSGRLKQIRLRLRRRVITGKPEWDQGDEAGAESTEGALSPGEPLAALAATGVSDPPLIGRDGVLDQALDLIRSSPQPGAPSAILLTGEPGIGKTRMLRELVRETRTAGGWVLVGRVFETEEIRPYGPWIDMLRQIPHAMIDENSARGLAGLVGIPRGVRESGGPAERSQLFDAAAGLLRRMALADPIGLIVLDDVQWMDAASAGLLHFLARSLSTFPVTMALAARKKEIEEGSIMARVLRSLDEEGHLFHLPLRRLDGAETETLIRAVDSPADARSVYITSEGNPLFALALAESWRGEDRRLPSTIEEELQDRLGRLGDSARSLLPWAAALGRVFDVNTLVQVLERPTHDIIENMDWLARRGILRASGADRYDFSHSLLRQAAYRRPSAPARRAIHRRIAEVLDALDQKASRLPGAVAHHAELGGLPELAVRAYVKAAEASLWVFAFDEVAELVERGFSQVEALPEEVRVPLEMDLLRVYSFRSMKALRPADVEARVRQVTDEARRGGMSSIVATGHALLMELEYQRGAFEAAGRSSVRSAEAGRAGEPDIAARALAETAACLLILDQSPREARRLALEAVALSREHELHLDVVALAWALLHHWDGKFGQAIEAFDEVVRRGRRAKDRWWESQAMTRISMVELDRDEVKAALRRAREAGELAERAHDAPEAAFSRGLAAVAMGRDAGEGHDAEAGMVDPLSQLDRALQDLRDLDGLWKIAHLQAYGAELELRRGEPHIARERAQELRRAACTLERPSLLALSCGLLASSAAMCGDFDEWARILESPDVHLPQHRLSYRARQAVERAQSMAG